MYAPCGPSVRAEELTKSRKIPTTESIAAPLSNWRGQAQNMFKHGAIWRFFLDHANALGGGATWALKINEIGDMWRVACFGARPCEMAVWLGMAVQNRCKQELDWSSQDLGTNIRVGLHFADGDTFKYFQPPDDVLGLGDGAVHRCFAFPGNVLTDAEERALNPWGPDAGQKIGSTQYTAGFFDTLMSEIENVGVKDRWIKAKYTKKKKSGVFSLAYKGGECEPAGDG